MSPPLDEGFAILVIDDQERFLPLIEKAIEGSALRAIQLQDVRAAKRRLLQSQPELIVCPVAFLTDDEGGYSFCRELQAHETLQNIPVLLIADTLSEETLTKATDSGARGAMAWPSSVEAIRHRLTAIFPQLSKMTAAAKIEPAPAARGEISFQSPPTVDSQLSDEQKIQRAQQILAKVLHNLKTSQLLAAADMEDIPRIVLEITRAVCGVTADTPRPSSRPPGRPTKPAGNTGVELDLESAFGRKK